MAAFENGVGKSFTAEERKTYIINIRNCTQIISIFRKLLSKTRCV